VSIPNITNTYIESALMAVNEAYKANDETITGLQRLKENDPTGLIKDFLIMFQALHKELRIAKTNLESAKDWNDKSRDETKKRKC